MTAGPCYSDGVRGAIVATDYAIATRLGLMVDRASTCVIGDYARVAVTVRVTSSTAGGEHAVLPRAALAHGRRVQVSATCSGNRFVCTTPPNRRD